MKKIIILITLFMGFMLNAQDILKIGVTQSSKQVSTASKNSEKLSDAPGIISVITKEEIAAFGSISSLWDVLNRATSMYMLHAGVLTWNVASIRGQNTTAYDTRTLILLNGRPMREGISGGFNSVIYNSFPVESIERIEIIRGPGSVLYGSNAFSGVINIITAKADEESHFQASTQYGSFNTKAINMGGGIHVNDDLNINFGGRWYDDDGSDFGGVYDAVFKKNGNVWPSVQKKEAWSKDNKSFFMDINYKNLKLAGGYGDIQPFSFIRPIKWDWKGAHAGDEIAVKRYYSDIGYSADLNNIFSLSANLTYNGINEYGFDSIPNQLKAKSKDILGELALQSAPCAKIDFVIGGTFDINKYSAINFIEDGTDVKYSLYSQAQFKPIEKLKLILGAQLNASSMYKANVSPRLGLIYNANENLGVKALYSTAFRAPFPEETDILHPVYIGNPTLTPELINTAELQLFYSKKDFNTSLTIFRSEMKDVIHKRAVSPDDEGIDFQGRNISYFNEGGALFSGIEWEMKYRINTHFSVLANATVQKNEGWQKGSETRIKQAVMAPYAMAKAGLMYHSDIISGGIFNAYFGAPEQNNYVLTQMGMEAREELNPKATAYNQLSLNVDFHLLKIFKVESKYGLSFGIFGDNLLDESIWYPEFVLRTINTLPLHPGRSISGKLAFKF